MRLEGIILFLSSHGQNPVSCFMCSLLSWVSCLVVPLYSIYLPRGGFRFILVVSIFFYTAPSPHSCFSGGWMASQPRWPPSSPPALSSTSTVVRTVSFRRSRWSASWPSSGSEGGGCTPGAWTPPLTWSTSARFLMTTPPGCCTSCRSACPIWHKIKGQVLAHTWRRAELAKCWLLCAVQRTPVSPSTWRASPPPSLSIVHLSLVQGVCCEGHALSVDAW